MATDVLNNKFQTTLHISSKKVEGKPIDNDEDVAVLSIFLPASLAKSLPKSDFKCARMEDCFYGDPKLAPPGNFLIFEHEKKNCL